MKCLPQAKVPGTQGCVLHDWHAEMLAIRAFNHFLLQECISLLGISGQSSPTVLELSSQAAGSGACQPFSIKEGVKIHMYCSAAPCGDASMELVMEAQKDATPWAIPDLDREEGTPTRLKGHENFSELGIVRRKPGKAVNA